MAQGHSKKLRLVDGLDAESILSEVVDPKRGTVFEKWLRVRPEAHALFWDVMEKGYINRGMAFAHVLRAYLKHFEDAPTVDEQGIKRLVDAKFKKV